MKCFIILCIVCIGVCSGLFGSNSGPDWDALKATWGPNPLSKEYFVEQPRTVYEAIDQGFIPIDNQCGGKFLGQRYMKGDDLGVILIYDTRGTIAGIQMAIPATMIIDKWYPFSTQKMFNFDTIRVVDVYVLTAYFVYPAIICTTGRTGAQIENEGTGEGLWFQNGTDPIRDSLLMPLYEDNVGVTKWVKGACFPSMGIHYWYDNRLDMDCREFFPAFLLYNKGKLTGFGWRVFGKYEYSKRTEFPPSTASIFLKPIPTCMDQQYKDAGGVTSMHIYFNTEPWNLLC